MKETTIVQKVYDLLRFSIPVLNRFPKNQKFILADRIQNLISDLLELYIEAYYLPPNRKLPLLHKANIQLEKIRNFVRLCYDLGIFSSLKYRDFAERLHEIGKMTSGWIKSLEKKKEP